MKLTPEVLAVLGTATLEGHNLRIPGQLDPAMYRQVNRALEAAGGKWHRHAKAHVFDDPDRFEQMLLLGEVVDGRRDFDAFYTLPAVAKIVCDLADVRPGHRVLEPSVGAGDLIVPMLTTVPGLTVTCYDAQPIDGRLLVGLPGTIIETQGATDFLTVPPSPAYHRVIMNPPFSRQADMAPRQARLAVRLRPRPARRGDVAGMDVPRIDSGSRVPGVARRRRRGGRVVGMDAAAGRVVQGVRHVGGHGPAHGRFLTTRPLPPHALPD